MVSFDADADLMHPFDYDLVQNGPVVLFWRSQVLDDTLAWLADHGYQAVTIDCSKWHDETDLHSGFAEALDFPSYYGRNLDALNDCLGDVVMRSYGAQADATGFVLVLRRFDVFFRLDAWTAQRALDAIARQASKGFMFGYRTMCLLQSDDPNIRFEPLGAFRADWNRSEWLNASRVQ